MRAPPWHLILSLCQNCFLLVNEEVEPESLSWPQSEIISNLSPSKLLILPVPIISIFSFFNQRDYDLRMVAKYFLGLKYFRWPKYFCVSALRLISHWCRCWQLLLCVLQQQDQEASWVRWPYVQVLDSSSWVQAGSAEQGPPNPMPNLDNLNRQIFLFYRCHFSLNTQAFTI